MQIYEEMKENEDVRLIDILQRMVNSSARPGQLFQDHVSTKIIHKMQGVRFEKAL